MSVSWLFLSQIYLLENIKNKKEKGRKAIKNPFRFEEKKYFFAALPPFFFSFFTDFFFFQLRC